MFLFELDFNYLGVFFGSAL